MNFWVIKSLTESNTWYIFRDNGIEVVLRVRNNVVYPSHKINDMEVKYIVDTILKRESNNYN